ncbi:two component transcriptional regulator, LuxR family [Actinobacteria bacterium OK074]|nr:two component transcriptional regulator, LuxR family [Actinobacteria bacterium OK074]
MTGMIRILIATREHTVRGSIAGLLTLHDDVGTVVEAGDGADALRLARRHKPDVAMLSDQLPGPDVGTVVEQLSRALPDCKILVMSRRGMPGRLKQTLPHDVGHVVAESAFALQLVSVIRQVHAGRRVDPYVSVETHAGGCPLSRREADILTLAADGAPVRTIAERAALAPGTVRNYLSSVTRKLGADNHHAAVHLALRRGWI